LDPRRKNILCADEVTSIEGILKEEIERFRPVQIQQQSEPSTLEEIN
jgi:hypothetical protein